MKWSFKNENYNNNLDFNRDIFGSQLFYLIKQSFISYISKIIPSKISETKKNKDRILDNLFCHWYFWEAYCSNYSKIHPLLLENELNYLSLKNILDDYFINTKREIKIDKIISDLNLDKKIKKSIKLLNDKKDINCWFNIITTNYELKIKVYTGISNFIINISKLIGDKLIKKLGEEKFVRLIFRYYVLGSNNNQLATNSTKIYEINPDIELFSSGFNNSCINFCSIFPDLECDLGSLGRFQDIEIYSGIYHINPPFQTTMIYDIIKKIKNWINKANSNNNYLEFHLFLPNWLNSSNNLKYSKYLVLELANEIEGIVLVNNLKNIDFNYIDYWNNKIRNYTLPNTLNLIIKSKKK